MQSEIPDLPFNLVSDEGQWFDHDAELARRKAVKEQEQAQMRMFEDNDDPT